MPTCEHVYTVGLHKGEACNSESDNIYCKRHINLKHHKVYQCIGNCHKKIDDSIKVVRCEELTYSESQRCQKHFKRGFNARANALKHSEHTVPEEITNI